MKNVQRSNDAMIAIAPQHKNKRNRHDRRAYIIMFGEKAQQKATRQAQRERK